MVPEPRSRTDSKITICQVIELFTLVVTGSCNKVDKNLGIIRKE